MEVLNNINLGKDSENDFKESNSITILKRIVEKNRKIKARTAEADKIPNLDGKLMLLDDNRVERNTIEIQIKVLPSGYNLKTPYSYSCDTKVFNVVLHHITLNPVVLIMVDIENEKVYWKYISREYAESLNIGNQKNKTIQFTEDNLFIEEIFIKEMEDTYTKMYEKIDANSAKKSIIYSNINEKSKDYVELQIQVDRLNNLFNNELKEIKNLFFRNVWKFGIAYDKYSNGSAIGIYMIMLGENNTLIKRFDPRQGYSYMSMNFKEIVNIKDYVDMWVADVIKRYYLKVPLDASNLSNEVLNEIIFYFLDNLTITIRELESYNLSKTYYKDEENLDTIINYINGLELFFEYVMSTKGTPDETPVVSLLAPAYECTGQFLVFNMLLQLTDNEKQLLHQYITQNNPSAKIKFYSSSDCDIKLSLLAIKELQKRGINKIERIWNIRDRELCKKDFQDFKYTRAGYSKKNVHINTNKYFDILKSNYDYVFNKMKLPKDCYLESSHNILLDEQSPYSCIDYIINSHEFEIKKINENYCKDDYDKMLEEHKYDSKFVFELNSLFLLGTPLYHTIRLLIYIAIAKKAGYEFEKRSRIFDDIKLSQIPIVNYYIK